MALQNMNEVEALLEKYNNGTATKEEIILVESWYLQYKTPEGNLSHEQIEEEYKMGLADLSKRINNNPIRLWPRIAAAASILIFLSAGNYFLLRKQPERLVVQNHQDIAPGKNAAILTLANGHKIFLGSAANGLLAKQSGVTISKTATGQIVYHITATTDTVLQYNLISTVNGEQYKVILQDGTAVTLNAASSLKYPSNFTRLKQRKVELTGEAYFAVVHNASQPFAVLTKGQQVDDIGTEFNINSYMDEPGIKTTLVAGSAKIVTNKTSAVLTPNDQAVLNGDVLKVSKVDASVYIAWKDGRFTYQGTALQEVMRQVARWYNVQIAYNNEDLKSKRLSGGVSRYDKVSGILNAIEYTAKVKFKIEGRKITVFDAE
jgi:transmembrane sensor